MKPPRHTLIDLYQGRPPAKHTVLDPRQVAVDHALTDASTLCLPEPLGTQLAESFRKSTATQPWNEGDEAFAAQLSRRYFEAFHLRDSLDETQQHRVGDLQAMEDARSVPESSIDAIYKQLGNDARTISALSKIETGQITADALSHLAREPVGNKRYDPETALKFVGTIIRNAVTTYSRYGGRAPHVFPGYHRTCMHARVVGSTLRESGRLTRTLAAYDDTSPTR